MGGDKVSHIVNIGSMGGLQGSAKFPGLSYYSASKAALSCLSECLAEEFKNRNIRVNCLALVHKFFNGRVIPVSVSTP